MIINEKVTERGGRKAIRDFQNGIEIRQDKISIR